MNSALFLMQRKGSQAVDVIEVGDAEKKKTREGSRFFDSCCLLMRLTNFWWRVGECLNAKLLWV